MANGSRGGQVNLRNDFLSGLTGATIIAVINGLRIFRLADFYSSEGSLRNEILWSLGFFILYVLFWMGSAAAGRWLKARFTRITEPTKEK